MLWETERCAGCGGRNRAAGRLCRGCQTHLRNMQKEADGLRWIVDTTGGSWWVWDKRGDVLGCGDTRYLALEDAFVKIGD